MENYFYAPATRLLYANALEDRYRESGNWPNEGFTVDAAIARAYIEHPERAEMEIVVDADGAAEIAPIVHVAPVEPEEPKEEPLPS